MISIVKFREAIEAQANKDGLGNQPNDKEFNSFVNDGVREIYNWLFGWPGDYRLGAPVAAVSSEKTKMITEAERYLHEQRTLTLDNGRFSIPNGSTVFDTDNEVCPAFRHEKRVLIHYVTPSGVLKKRRVTLLPSMDLDLRLTSAIAPPTGMYPVGYMAGGHIEVYTGQDIVQHVELVYQRRAVEAKWAVTYDTSLPLNERRPIFSEADSVDIDMPDELSNLLKEKVLYMMGGRERDPLAIEMAAKREKTNV